jgi:hypothetical protein
MFLLPRLAIASWRSFRLKARARRHARENPPRIRRLIVMLQNGCMASEIGFEGAPGVYTNGTSSDKCRIFNLAGGGMTYQAPTAAALTTPGDYLFTGNVCVDNAGTGPAATCATDSLPNEDLVLIAPFVLPEVCDAINLTLGNPSGFFQDASGSFNGTRFTGAFADGTAIGPTAHQVGCHQSTGGAPGSGYHFYYTLLAR